MKTIKPSGYGTLTNIPHFEQVYMVVIKQGDGTDENPIHDVRWFYTKDCQFICREDEWSNRPLSEE